MPLLAPSLLQSALGHKPLCLVSFRFSIWRPAIHFRRLPSSLMPGVKLFLLSVDGKH